MPEVKVSVETDEKSRGALVSVRLRPGQRVSDFGRAFERRFKERAQIEAVKPPVERFPAVLLSVRLRGIGEGAFRGFCSDEGWTVVRAGRVRE